MKPFSWREPNRIKIDSDHTWIQQRQWPVETSRHSCRYSPYIGISGHLLFHHHHLNIIQAELFFKQQWGWVKWGVELQAQARHQGPGRSQQKLDTDTQTAVVRSVDHKSWWGESFSTDVSKYIRFWQLQLDMYFGNFWPITRHAYAKILYLG